MTVLDESRGLMHAGSVVGLCDKYPPRHQASDCAKDPKEALLLSYLLRLCLSHHRHLKSDAAPRFRVDPDRPAVGLDDASNNCQTQAGPSLRSGTGRVAFGDLFKSRLPECRGSTREVVSAMTLNDTAPTRR